MEVLGRHSAGDSGRGFLGRVSNEYLMHTKFIHLLLFSKYYQYLHVHVHVDVHVHACNVYVHTHSSG